MLVPIEIKEKDKVDKLIYIYTSEGSEFLKEEELKKGEGITFEIWKSIPKNEEEEEEVIEEEEEEGVEKALKPIPGIKKVKIEWEPKTLKVPQVLVESKMKYFDIPKLGSYGACKCKNEN